MNADRIVKLAKQYTKKVGEQLISEKEPTPASTLSKRDKATPLTGGTPVTLSFDIEAEDTKINYLEHVEVLSNIQYPRRGCLEIKLVSPSGTGSKVLSGRFQDDDSTKGFNNWRFMSVHFWGEDPSGTWLLHVKNNDNDQRCKQTRDVTFGDMKLVLYGTEEQPSVVGMEPRSLDNLDRSLNNLEDDVEDEEGELIQMRENREEDGFKLNSHTNWKDLVGDNVLVRDADLYD